MAAVASGAPSHAQRATAARASASALAPLIVLGAVLRLLVAHQSLFGDELNTQWIVSTHGLGGVLAAVRDDTEITPPLYFVAAWLTTRLGLTPELLRAPSLLAGVAAIPLVHALGGRTVGRRAALVAAAVTALSPFMVFYSAEARGYELMTVLALLSTFALLAALRDARRRWWLAYAAASAAAMYTHYTAVFVLAAQLCWAWWAHPRARPALLGANVLAALAYLPWLPGLVNDLRSPDGRAMSVLFPFTPGAVRVTLEHWAIGFPFAIPGTGIAALPGTIGAVLLAVALVVAAGGALAGRRGLRPSRRQVLVGLLALATPVGAALASAVGPHLFATRNLAASWPWLALALGVLLATPRPRLAAAATAMAIAAFALGAIRMITPSFQRPDFRAAAGEVERTATPGDVVVDDAAAFVTPGPVTGLDAALERPLATLRNGVPQEREHNFRDDPVLPAGEVVRRAAARADGHRILVVSFAAQYGPTVRGWDERLGKGPAPYARVAARRYRGFVPLEVLTYAPQR